MAKVFKHGHSMSAPSTPVAIFSLLYNLKFVAMNQTVIKDMTSVTSKFFHRALVECRNFKGTEIKISALASSPIIDGIHIEQSSSSHIGIGDDYISIGQGNSDITITGITCGSGHGIRQTIKH
ncbi:Glycoside hydrolase, family 28 [Dillenia turbinata]|uniref:Glycoside hydrolase, family 28 n=1 Tax=Dillenia turbinata TaxID=194707 RepID=A0AAN8YXL2_9MAGN